MDDRTSSICLSLSAPAGLVDCPPGVLRENDKADGRHC